MQLGIIDTDGSSGPISAAYDTFGFTDVFGAYIAWMQHDPQ
jgi:hypothetical protein